MTLVQMTASPEVVEKIKQHAVKSVNRHAYVVSAKWRNFRQAELTHQVYLVYASKPEKAIRAVQEFDPATLGMQVEVARELFVETRGTVDKVALLSGASI